MTKPRKERLSSAYSTLHEELLNILYDEDPEGMGVTAGTPDDEYSPEVSKLIPRLQRTAGRDAVAGVVLEMFPAASNSLINEVSDAWARFLHETE